MVIDRSLENLVQFVIDRSIERDDCRPTIWDVYEEVLWRLSKDFDDDKDNEIYISVREIYYEYLD